MNTNQVSAQLKKKQEELLARKQRLLSEDPFGDPDRLENNAAVDADAAEQFGHDNVSAMVQEIDWKLKAIEKSFGRIGDGSYGTCAGCNKQIEAGRLEIDPTAEYCVSCQQKKTVVDVG